jgi:hypothetical protein
VVEVFTVDGVVHIALDGKIVKRHDAVHNPRAGEGPRCGASGHQCPARPDAGLVQWTSMKDDRIVTAAELEAMSPNERADLLNSRVVTDLSTVDPEFLARVRAKGRALLEARGILKPSD